MCSRFLFLTLWKHSLPADMPQHRLTEQVQYSIYNLQFSKSTPRKDRLYDRGFFFFQAIKTFSKHSGIQTTRPYSNTVLGSQAWKGATTLLTVGIHCRWGVILPTPATSQEEGGDFYPTNQSQENGRNNFTYSRAAQSQLSPAAGP